MLSGRLCSRPGCELRESYAWTGHRRADIKADRSGHIKRLITIILATVVTVVIGCSGDRLSARSRLTAVPPPPGANTAGEKLKQLK